MIVIRWITNDDTFMTTGHWVTTIGGITTNQDIQQTVDTHNNHVITLNSFAEKDTEGHWIRLSMMERGTSENGVHPFPYSSIDIRYEFTDFEHCHTSTISFLQNIH